MILVDTSVWVTHLRKDLPSLRQRLMDGFVLGHPFVVGELTCSQFKNRKHVLSLLETLPQAKMAENDEVLHFIEIKRLMGKGIGWIDAHLLASTVLSHASLWTQDNALWKAAKELSVACDPFQV